MPLPSFQLARDRGADCERARIESSELPPELSCCLTQVAKRVWKGQQIGCLPAADGTRLSSFANRRHIAQPSAMSTNSTRANQPMIVRQISRGLRWIEITPFSFSSLEISRTTEGRALPSTSQ